MTERERQEALIRAYKVTFGMPDGRIVLTDLATFCHASETCFSSDPYTHAFMAGQRDVFLRIAQFSMLTPENVLHLAERRFARVIMTSTETDE